MIYDKFGAEGNCRGCGGVTEFFIDGEYPICPDCVKRLTSDIETTLELIKKQNDKLQEEE